MITSCGAISGFHSLVGSGTTARQVARESQARYVGYGAMLLESLLGVISLCAVMGLSLAEYQGLLKNQGPIATFATGVAGFFGAPGIPVEKGKAFAALAVSAFALTSLDTATRVSRFMLEELFARKRKQTSTLRSRMFFTLVVVGLAAALAFSGAWQKIWPLMGSANQLLAALALLSLTVWLMVLRRPSAFVGLPAFFMLAVTISALGILFFKNLGSGHLLLSVLSLGLLVLTGSLLWITARRFLKSP